MFPVTVINASDPGSILGRSVFGSVDVLVASLQKRANEKRADKIAETPERSRSKTVASGIQPRWMLDLKTVFDRFDILLSDHCITLCLVYCIACLEMVKMTEPPIIPTIVCSFSISNFYLITKQ